MNGAESLVATLVAGGVEVCFTNPGTSEMHIVAALDRATKIRCVLALFEGVVTGAADGYARMADKPACTLLHLGPGIANGLANLHNAARAHSPIVSIIGQHATEHLKHDTPLKSDIAAIAQPYSHWLRTCSSVRSIGNDTAEAISAARTAPGQIATLIVPADFAWSSGGMVATVANPPAPHPPAQENIDRAAAMLRSGARTCLLLSGCALRGAGLAAAGRIAAATGAQLLAPYPFARMQRGSNLPNVVRLPYIFEQAAALLQEFQQMILVGAAAPRSYFAHPTKESVPTPPDCQIHSLANSAEDLAGALESLAHAVHGDIASPARRPTENKSTPTGVITISGLAEAIAAVLPENAIVVDESMTSGRGLMEATVNAAPHDWLVNTGGSIGIAMPLAVGAAVACPQRPVLCLSADGSGMYTAQALWTMAREGLNITTVIYANRVYGVLKREFSSLGIGEPGQRALDLFEIGRPDIDWVSLAQGLGVPAIRATSLETVTAALRNGFVSAGPSLIQVDL